jgi:hypothetical protein
MRQKLARIDRKKAMFWLVIVMLTGIVSVFFGTIAVFAYFSKDLPSPTKVVRRDGLFKPDLRSKWSSIV